MRGLFKWPSTRFVSAGGLGEKDELITSRVTELYFTQYVPYSTGVDTAGSLQRSTGGWVGGEGAAVYKYVQGIVQDLGTAVLAGTKKTRGSPDKSRVLAWASKISSGN